MKTSIRRRACAVTLLLALPVVALAAPPNTFPAVAVPAKTRTAGVADSLGRLVGQVVPDYFGLSGTRLITNVQGVDVGVLVSPVEMRTTVNGVVTSRYVWQTIPTYTARYTQPNCAGSPIIEDRGYVELDAVRVTMLYQVASNPPTLLIAPAGPAQEYQVLSQGNPIGGSCDNVTFTTRGRSIERTVAWPYKELYPVRMN